MMKKSQMTVLMEGWVEEEEATIFSSFCQGVIQRTTGEHRIE